MKPLVAVLTASCLVSLSVACSRDADKPRAPQVSASAPSVAPTVLGTTVLATIPDDAAPPSIPLPARGPHPVAPSGQLEFIFGEQGGGVAFVSERDGKLQVIHNGRAGKWYEVVADVILSADGKRCAYGALADGKWRIVVDGVEGPGFNRVELPVFSPDGAHVLYQAMAGERRHLVLDGKVNAGTRTRYARTYGFNADSSRIAFVDDVDDRDEGRLVVSDLAFKTQAVVDPAVREVIWNPDKSRLAAVAASGEGRRVVVADMEKPDGVTRGQSDDSVDGLAFGPDGLSVAYVTQRSGARFLVLNGREEPLPADLAGPLVIRPGGRAVGALVVSGGATAFRQFFADGAKPEAGYEEAEGLTYSGDGRLHAYAARRGTKWSVVVNGKEGPPFDRVVTPQFSADGRIVAYRARKDGRRFVVVADLDARTVRQHPPFEQVFPVRFTDEGRSLAYGVKDGRQLAWKVEAP
jgi:hypothetical protein